MDRCGCKIVIGSDKLCPLKCSPVAVYLLGRRKVTTFYWNIDNLIGHRKSQCVSSECTSTDRRKLEDRRCRMAAVFNGLCIAAASDLLQLLITHTHTHTHTHTCNSWPQYWFVISRSSNIFLSVKRSLPEGETLVEVATDNRNNKRSKNIDERPHRKSCRYRRLNWVTPFAAYIAAEIPNAFQ